MPVGADSKTVERRAEEARMLVTAKQLLRRWTVFREAGLVLRCTNSKQRMIREKFCQCIIQQTNGK